MILFLYVKTENTIVVMAFVKKTGLLSRWDRTHSFTFELEPKTEMMTITMYTCNRSWRKLEFLIIVHQHEQQLLNDHAVSKTN